MTMKGIAMTDSRRKGNHNTRVWHFPLMLALTAASALPGSAGATKHQSLSQSPAAEQTISLSSGLTARLSTDWAQQPYDRIPPHSALAAYAPPDVSFSEFLRLQNLNAHSLLMLGVSNNFLLRRDARYLDARMHEPPDSGHGLLNHLFHFFFPPPPHCLESAHSQYLRALSDAKSDENAPPDVRISSDCRYLPTLSDFYSAQLSQALVFSRVSGVESVDSTWGRFYLPPMEQVESNGLTFFVFEAQGEQQLSLDTARRFNLPDDFQGAQPDFFWAIGAPTPFPFVRDPARGNVQLVHVVYAGVGLGANKRPVFMKLLRKITAPAP